MVASLSAWAATVNTVISSEALNKTSTVYVGEVVVDGQSVIKYIYSGDITLSTVIIENLQDGLNGMADGDYAALLAAHEFSYNTQASGFALCSNPDLEASMDANWSSAQYVGTLLYSDKTVKAEINSNLYDLDDGFKAVLDAKQQERAGYIDNLADAEKCIVSHRGADSYNNVWYEAGEELIKHVDTIVTYDSEATTVVYTKVELESTITGVEDIVVPTAKTGARYNLMGQPVGKDYKGIVIEDGRKIIIK